MPYAEFGTDRPKRGEPIRFRLIDEEFEALPAAPAGAVNDLMAGITLDDQGNRRYEAGNLVRFVAQVLIDEYAEPLADGVAPDGAVDVITVAEAEERMLYVDPAWHADKVAVMPADDVSRFVALVHDKHRIVEVDVLGNLVMWLAERLTGRPLVPSARSSRGRR